MTELLERRLLYEKISTVSLQVIMKDSVNEGQLQIAANKAIKRYPYFSVCVVKDKNNLLQCKYNPKPIPVVKYNNKAGVVLGSEGLGKHLICVEYDNNTIYFDWAHCLCGANGIIEYAKTTLYEYCRLVYKKDIDSSDINLTDSPLLEGERKTPSYDELKNETPDFVDSKMKGLFPLRYLLEGLLFGTTMAMVEIPQSDLIKFSKKNDGSVAASITMLTALSWQRFSRSKKAIIGYITHNCRNELDCKNSTCDFAISIPVLFSPELLRREPELIGTYVRSQLMLKTMEGNMKSLYKKIFETTLDFEKIKDIRKRRKVAGKFSNNHATLACDKVPAFSVSYVGLTKCKGIEEYISGIYTSAYGSIMTEVNAIGNKIFLTFNMPRTNRKFFYIFLGMLNEYGVSYKIEKYENQVLPKIEPFGKKIFSASSLQC